MGVEDCETATPFNIETITFFSRLEDEPLPSVAGHRQCVSPYINRVCLNLHTAGGRRLGRLSIPPLPLDKLERWPLIMGREECTIPVYGAVRRASAWEDLSANNAAEVSLRDAIDFLSGYFTEAISLTHDEAHSEFRDFARQAIVRLDWATVWERWKKVSTGDEPRMARVVEIAFSHLRGICDVSERPRRMLLRQRETLTVGRVQELDSTCLRDLIRRPGHTVLEKAGARQEILAITRRETVDTAENRVIRDFIRLCQHRARAYERENSQAAQRGHTRLTGVVRLRQTCERLDTASPIATVGRLVGVARPNYVLQKDRRYHPLWVQYDKLRREEAEIDNVWVWGRRLWAEFIRGVVTSYMYSAEGRNNTGWQHDGDVAAYLRAEHLSGSFAPALSVSSRWRHRNGHSRMFLIHPEHSHLCPALEELLPRLGADLTLVVYPPDEEATRPKALLSIYSIMSLQTDMQQREGVAVNLSVALDQLAKDNPTINIHGLLLRGDWAKDSLPKTPRLGRLDCLTAPAGGRFWFHEFPQLLSVLLEEIAE